MSKNIDSIKIQRIKDIIVRLNTYGSESLSFNDLIKAINDIEEVVILD